MKRTILLLLVLWAGLTTITAVAATSHRLCFNEGRFKIAQFTDLHWDANSKNNAQNRANILAVVQMEHPDLCVLTGDVVTERPSVEGWHEVIALFEQTRTPYVVLMGNHDAEKLTVDSIYALLEASPWHVGQRGPAGITGAGNCVLPVYGSGAGSEAEALLYCLDSNDYPATTRLGHYDWIHFDQIAWYREQSRHYTQAHGGKPLPALMFFHIPLPEFELLSNDDATCGHQLEGVACSKVNSGMLASIIDEGDVMGVFCGHDHDNDCIGQFLDIALAYGRVSGLDAYGQLQRGARIIELHEGQRKFDSWIATPQGREAIYYYPSGINSEQERLSMYSPAVAANGLVPGVSYTYREGMFKSCNDLSNGTVKARGTMSNFSIADAPAKDHFGYEYTGYIDVPERGVYNFYLYSDDGSRLYIDGKLVVDNDGSHSAERKGGHIALEQGMHAIVLQYFEDYMGQSLQVRVSARNMPEQDVPSSMLFHKQ